MQRYVGMYTLDHNGIVRPLVCPSNHLHSIYLLFYSVPLFPLLYGTSLEREGESVCYYDCTKWVVTVEGASYVYTNYYTVRGYMCVCM